MTFDWISDALAANVPDLGGVCYVLPGDALPGTLRGNTIGVYHRQAWLAVRDHLQQTGQWRGIGLAVLVSDDPAYDPLSIAIHETAHYLTDSPIVTTEEFLSSTTEHAVGQAVALLQSELTSDAASTTITAPWLNGGDHTLPFIRACCHVRHRLEMGGLFCSPAQILSPTYKLSSFGSYFSIMADECRDLADKPIRQILKIKPPRKAKALWLSDIGFPTLPAFMEQSK